MPRARKIRYKNEQESRIARLASEYYSKGFGVVKIKAGAEVPDDEDLELARILTPENNAQSDSTGLALILGDRYNHLVDLHLASEEARVLATDYLPYTKAAFGSNTTCPTHMLHEAFIDQSSVFKDPIIGDTILEVRTSKTHSGTAVLQTVTVPPTLLPSGDRLEWLDPDDYNPNFVAKPEDLTIMPADIAVSVIIARRMNIRPGAASYRIILDFLVLCGISLKRVRKIIRMVGTLLNDGVGQDSMKKIIVSLESNSRSHPFIIKYDFDKLMGESKVAPTLMEYLDVKLPAYMKKSETEKFVQWLANHLDELTQVFISDYIGFTYQNRIAYCGENKRWYYYDEIQWLEDTKNHVQGLVKEKLRQLKNGSKCIDSEKSRSKYLKAINTFLTQSKIQNIISLSRDSCTINLRDFDSDDYMLNCNNGVLDLRTQTLEDHSPDHFMMKKVNCDYNQNANAPRFMQFLNDIFKGDEDLIRYVQKMCGYCLSGSIKEQKLFMFHGTGANGKSVLLNVLYKLFGDYASRNPSESLLHKKTPPVSNDLARLEGVRLAISSEIGAGNRLHESRIKQITGGEAITVRYLHNEFIEYTPKFKLIISTNELPKMDGADSAITRRLKVIPFNVSFSEEDQDKDLITKLTHELPGILAWAVEGFKLWHDEGLKDSIDVHGATSDYREEMDTVGSFLKACCEPDTSASIHHQILYQAYEKWAEAFNQEIETKKGFTNKMKKHGYSSKRITKGKPHIRGRMQFMGIKLSES